MVDSLVAFHLERYKATGAELIMGAARLVGAEDGRGGAERRRDAAAGRRQAVPQPRHARHAFRRFPASPRLQPLTNIEALELDRLPDHLIVLGGGYVGLEFAQAYRRFGSRVTVIEHGPRLLEPRRSGRLATKFERILEAKASKCFLSAEIEQVEGRSGEHVRVRVRAPDGEQTIEGTDILVAAGRTPNTAGIGLEEAGIELTDRGYIRVNDRLETTAPDIWAIGECAGSPQFTHVSLDDFRVIRDNLGGGDTTTAGGWCPTACSSIRRWPGSG